MRRLPRRVHVGRGYVLSIQSKPPKWFRERFGEQLAGAFEASLGNSPAGTIYIRSDMSYAKRWATYWHELMHAVHDIAAWDAYKLRT